MRRSERGATLIIVAVSLVALMVIAAMALDLSLVRQNRQDDKSASDFAVAAGIRGLDNGSGGVQPWKGVCAARDYLVANQGELGSITETFADGAGTPVAGSPCTAPPATTCIDGNPATWARLSASADGGRIRVTIQNGYPLPDPAFAEDAAAYAGDVGDGPCSNLSVIFEEGEQSRFGGVAGVSGYESVIRSVARLTKGTTGEVTAALLILERNDCLVLEIGGTSGAEVVVEGNGDDPGVIHADSLGNGADCDEGSVQNGNIFQVNSNPPDPRITAGRSPSGSQAGQISTAALSGAAGAVPGVASSPSPDEVCGQEAATDCGTVAPITGGSLAGRPVQGRGRVDVRYRLPIIALRSSATTRFAWSAASPPPAGWTIVPCNDAASTYTAPRIWIDCDGGVFTGNGKTFAASVDEVVVNGSVTVNGNGNTLHLVDVETFFVEGAAGGDGLSLFGSNNRILINDGGVSDADADGFVCDERATLAPAARTKLVVGSGRVVGEGGNGKVLRMCNTTVYLMDDSGSPGCPVPTSDGAAPYDNACAGSIRVAGNNKLEWTAPNVNMVSAPTAAQLDELEDLAFWTETQLGSSIEGNGGVLLSGIFFTPNADPFRVGGQGDYDIEDAQFITRKLQVAGNGTLTMRPQPHNSIQIPVLGGFTLVR